jgi:2-hydroxy-3-keto-5-methylthiopentenyl-1-phosphate phosphatase
VDPNLFIAIDFDGTVTDVDIIDAVLQEFARPEWQEVETRWEQGIIGSRKCLEDQMSLVNHPLGKLLDYIDTFTIDKTFKEFTFSLNDQRIPYAILSDGFQVFIERLLNNAGLKRVPVYANLLTEENGKLKAQFPHAHADCDSANCKCMVVDRLSKERPVILIGDGRSDFCLAQKASHVFTKKSLTHYCQVNNLSHTPFNNFAEITTFLGTRRMPAHKLQSVIEGME